MMGITPRYGTDSLLTSRMVADRNRVATALGADASSGYQSELLLSDPVRSFLFRAITRQRNLGLIPDDVFETILKSAQSMTGRKCLLSFFNAPEGVAA